MLFRSILRTFQRLNRLRALCDDSSFDSSFISTSISSSSTVREQKASDGRDRTIFYRNFQNFYSYGSIMQGDKNKMEDPPLVVTSRMVFYPIFLESGDRERRL